MALYWPQSKIALQVDDDPYSLPFDAEAFPGTRVFHTTVADMCNPQAAARMARTMAHEMGIRLPQRAADDIAQHQALFPTLFGEQPIGVGKRPEPTDAAA